MSRHSLSIALTLVLAWMSTPVQARQWSDITGKYTLEADLVGFDDQMVVLQRKDKMLGSCPIERLSEQDREYLKSKEAASIHDANLGKMQTWTTASGLKVIGRIVGFRKADVTLQRRRGKTYVNDKVYQNLPEIYQTMLLKIAARLENREFASKKEFEDWVRSMRGIPKTYHLEGVVLELENGDEYAVPFFLFSEVDQQILKPGFEAWLADQQDPGSQDDHSFRLQSLAAAYHQDQQVNQQIAVMNLNMQAIQAGLTSAWEVTLYPVVGNPMPPRWVVVLGRNSEEAKFNALTQNPGFRDGPIRRVSN